MSNDIGSLYCALSEQAKDAFLRWCISAWVPYEIGEDADYYERYSGILFPRSETDAIVSAILRKEKRISGRAETDRLGYYIAHEYALKFAYFISDIVDRMEYDDYLATLKPNEHDRWEEGDQQQAEEEAYIAIRKEQIAYLKTLLISERPDHEAAFTGQ